MRLPDADDLRSLLLIRRFELTLLDLFAAGKLGGTTHTCLGQEYIPVALQPLLREHDFIFSNHRGHGHYLTRWNDPAGLLAEIMGREGGICHGVGGSQHVYRPNYLSTGIQGQSLPVATGVALHLRRSRPGAVALAYLGDGSWGEGAVYEALNIARLWMLPLVVIVENNGIAQSTPLGLHMAGTIAGRAAGFDLSYVHVEHTEPRAIREVLGAPILAVRQGRRPLVVEFATMRLGPHSKGDDTRDTTEIEALGRRGWYEQVRLGYPDRLAEVEDEVSRSLATIVAEIESRPPARWSAS